MATYLNGQFLNDSDALLPISDLSIQRGYAVFDFLRTKNGLPLFIDNHLDRLFFSASEMHLSFKWTKPEIKSIINQLILGTDDLTLGVRIMVSGGYSPDGFNLSDPNLLITTKLVKVSMAEDFNRGIKIISFEHQRPLPQIKSINYQMAIWLQPLVKQKGVDDVLYCHQGFLREFPRSNVFVINKAGTLITPKENVLHGITRKNIISICSPDIAIEERPISLQELYDADEAFLTSTTKRVIPILEVDGRSINGGKIGPITKDLYRRYLAFEDDFRLQ